MRLHWIILISALLSGSGLFGATNAPFGLISGSTLRSETPSGGSFMPVFSANGRVVVFLSYAANIATNDDRTPYLDIFSYDLLSGHTELVSASAVGFGGGDANSTQPGVSADGRVVAFGSAAQNLSHLDTNHAADVFVRNLEARQTSLASRDGLTGSDVVGSGLPRISPDGRFVAFVSGRQLEGVPRPPSVYSSSDIFVRDLQSNEIRLVTQNPEGTMSGSGRSLLHSMTPDARYVLFSSSATNLVIGKPATASILAMDIYLRDTQIGVTHWISTNAASLLGDSYYNCFESAVSEDGQYAAFYCATNGGRTSLHYHQLATGGTVVISSNAVNSDSPQISANGRFVAYTEGTNVFVWDQQSQSNTVISVGMDGAYGPGVSHSPVMTPDGRRICFLSSATNLVTNIVNKRFQLYMRDMDAQATRLVSVNTNGAASAGQIDVTLPAISADGQRIAFESTAADLVANDFNEASDIFLHDPGTGQTIAISRAAEELTGRTAVRRSRIWPGSVSSNGQVIAFTTGDNLLDAADTNLLNDIFIRDLQSNSTLVVNTRPSGGFAAGWNGVDPKLSANGGYLLYAAVQQADPQYRATYYYWCNLRDRASFSITGLTTKAPTISADGRWIAFHSTDTPAVPNLNSIDSDNDVFVFDTFSNRFDVVSRSRQYYHTTSGDSINARISPDGRWVLYQSTATDSVWTNLAAGPWRVFARDMVTGVNVVSNRTEFVSAAPIGPNSASITYDADFTPDSRFAAVAWVHSTGSALVYDFATGTRQVIGQGCRNPAISDNGQFVAYETIPTNGAAKQVFVKNLGSGVATLVSSTTDGTGGNGNSSNPQITPDGRFVIFESTASNLTQNDTNGVSDIFIADRVVGTRMLVTVNRTGTGSGNGSSSMPVLSGDGRTLVFQSFASDLTERDFNETRDVFVLRLSEPDADADGMDDDWEVVFFGDLSRPGFGDFDGDSQSDLQEFRAGTDPTNSGSILRVLTLSEVGGGARTLLWSAVAGRSYRAQYKNELGDEWRDLGAIVRASGATGSITDSAEAGERRFYRVVLAE